MMTQTTEFSISLNHLRCSLCKGYLSCAPLQILPAGTWICGHCSLVSIDEPLYREFALENILCNFSFPCKFKNSGCEEQVLFNHVDQHESGCVYRTHSCPLVPKGSCLWKGSMLQIPDHFIKQHPNVIQKNIKFLLEVNQDKEGVLMCFSNSIPFLVTYMYSASTTTTASTLLYDVRYLSFNVEKVMCELLVNNDADRDYRCFLKGAHCSVYNGNFCEETVILSELVEALNRPSSVCVEIHLVVIESEQTHREVNYDLLERLRCEGCKGYLVPPLFNSKNKGVICYECTTKFNDCKPVKETSFLHKYIDETNHPCRWRGCEFIDKAGNIRKHEKVCQHRLYRCISTDCKVILTLQDTFAHLKQHGYKCFFGEFVYKIVLSQPCGYETAYSVKCNEIVCVKYRTCALVNEMSEEYRHKLRLFVPGVESIKIQAEIQVEHSHCKIKSQKFIVCGSGAFKVNNLPRCFKIHDRLRVNVKLTCHCSNCIE